MHFIEMFDGEKSNEFLGDQLQTHGELLILIKECGNDLTTMIGHVKVMGRSRAWDYDVYSVRDVNWGDLKSEKM